MNKNVWDKILNFLVFRISSTYGKIEKQKYYKKSQKADKISEKLLLKMIKKNKNTEFGKKYNFKEIKSIKDYQEKMPFTTYEDYKEYIECMVNTGKQKLITANKIDYFAHTSGTMGVTKMIPVCKESYRPYLNCATIFLHNLKNEIKKKQKGIIMGKGLNMIETESEITPGGIRTGFISAYAISSAKAIVPAITCIPSEVMDYGEEVDMKYIKARYALQDRNLLYIMAVFMSTITDFMKYIEENYEMLIKDIETGKINKLVKMPEEVRKKLEKKLKPDINRANELRKIFESKSEEPLVPRIWNKMTLVIAICTGEFSPFETKMRKYCGENIAFCYEMYASSESLIASSMEVEDKNYLLIPDSGFYEFIPIEEESTRPLLMNELEVGKLYEIVVTNLSGLYRYKIKDVIRVTGFKGKNPLIQFAYRKEQVINMGGVHLTIEHITNAIKAFEKDLGVNITDYSLYVNTDHVPARIELFIETEKEIAEEKICKLSQMWDGELEKVNAEHGRMLRVGESDNSVVYCVKAGTYNEYRNLKIKKGIPVNQIKTVRFIKKEKDLEFFLSSAKNKYILEESYHEK